MLFRLNTLCIVYFYTNLSEDLPPSPDYFFLLVRDLPSGAHRLSPERVATSHEHMLVVSPGKWRRGCGSDLEGEAETMLCPVPQNYAFLPTVVDGVLLPKMPEEMLAEKNFSTVPYIVGINKQEFGWILPLVRKCRPHRFAYSAHLITPPICGHITPHISGHRTLPSADPSLGPRQLSPSYKS